MSIPFLSFQKSDANARGILILGLFFDHNSDHNSWSFQLVSIGICCEYAVFSVGLVRLVSVHLDVVYNSNPVTSTTSSPSIGYNLGEVLFYHQKAQKPCNHGASEPFSFLEVG